MSSKRFPIGFNRTRKQNANVASQRASCYVNHWIRERIKLMPCKLKNLLYLFTLNGANCSHLHHTVQASLEVDAESQASQQEGTTAVEDKPFRFTKPDGIVSKLYSYQLESLTWMTVLLIPIYFALIMWFLHCLFIGNRGSRKSWHVLGDHTLSHLPR